MRLLNIIVILIVLAGGATWFWFWQAQQGVAPEILEESYTEEGDRYLDVSGARIRVREEGPKDAPVILLLHGFTYSLESWDGWADQLSDRYRVVRYDLLGHGLTGPDPKERYAPHERAAFVGDVMDALEIESAIIGGNSLGGLAAWRFASMQPERAEALLLISPGAYPINGAGDEPAEIPGSMIIYLQTVPELGLRASISYIYADPDSVPEERITEIGEMMRREGNGEAMIKSLEEFILPDPEADLANVTMPVLLMWGEADQVIPPAHGTRLLAVLPDAELITYPGIGHVAHEEATAATAEDAHQFLSARGLEK